MRLGDGAMAKLAWWVATHQNSSSTPLGVTLFALIEWKQTRGERRGTEWRRGRSDFAARRVWKDVVGKVERGGVAYLANKVLSQQNHRDITHTPNPICFSAKGEHTPHGHNVPCIPIYIKGDLFAKLKLTKLVNWPFATRELTLSIFLSAPYQGVAPTKKKL